MSKSYVVTALLVTLLFVIPAQSIDSDRDFSGKWVLDPASSEIRPLGKVDTALTIAQSDAAMACIGDQLQWSYPLDGTALRGRVGDESWNSTSKWEGATLLVNTLVSGAANSTLMERWTLSRDHNTLTIRRQVLRGGGETEGRIVYRREGTSSGGASESARNEPPPSVTWRRESGPIATRQPVLARRPEPAVQPEITVLMGTRILLSLINEISTKRAQEGDKVYLRTAAPVAVNGRVVVPTGSDVSGTITRTKAAGKVAGKGELFVRFDSLVLPNGTQRDFLARPSGGEGRVDGDRRTADGRTVMAGTGMGATIGAITRGLPGAAVGGAAGALAGVLLSRQQNVILHPGTHLEMILDRDLVFTSEELNRIQ